MTFKTVNFSSIFQIKIDIVMFGKNQIKKKKKNVVFSKFDLVKSSIKKKIKRMVS